MLPQSQRTNTKNEPNTRLSTHNARITIYKKATTQTTNNKQQITNNKQHATTPRIQTTTITATMTTHCLLLGHLARKSKDDRTKNSTDRIANVFEARNTRHTRSLSPPVYSDYSRATAGQEQIQIPHSTATQGRW